MSQKSSWESESCSTIPDEFICPLTLIIMCDPVMTKSGHSFERHAICQWLEKGHHTCPLTRRSLGISDLVTNHALRVKIKKWKELQQQNEISSNYETDDDNDSCISVEDPVAHLYGLTRQVVIHLRVVERSAADHTTSESQQQQQQVSSSRRSYHALARMWRTNRIR